MTTCGPFAILKIQTRERQLDGTTKLLSVNLLSERSGFCVTNWQPATAQPKAGGTWRDSSLAHGRRLALRKRGNIRDSLTLAVRNWNADALIRDTQDLRRLLEKAADYWTSDWQDEPVWILAQGVRETNPRYTVIADYSTPRDGYPYGGAFWQEVERAAFDQFPLEIEHEDFWRADEPGTGTCVEASGTQEWDTNTEWVAGTVLPVGTVYSLLQVATGRIFAGEPGQIWYSDNDGGAWAISTALPVGNVYSLLQTTTGRILAGETGQIWYSDNNGVAWNVLTVLPVSFVYSLLQTTTGRILAGEPGQIWYSDDNGATWFSATTLPVGDVRSLIQTITGRILAGEDEQIWYSDDNGATWGVITAAPTDFIYSMLQTTSNRILAGEATWSIRYSDNDGATWDVTIDAFAGIAISLLQATDGQILAGDNGQIWRSDDDGATWDIDTTAPVGGVFSFLQTTTGRIMAGAGGTIWYLGPPTIFDMGASDTCLDIAYIANKKNVANLTHIFIDSGGFGANLLPMTAFSVDLLPVAPAVNDAVYFGIETAIFDSGPFDNLVFDLDDVILYDNTYTILWEYISAAGPAWTTLNVSDGTNPGTGVFRNVGVNSVHWIPPSNWTIEDAGAGVTGYWVRARVSALAGNMTAPSQQNRNVYTTNWPDVDIDALQVPGDIGPLVQIKAHNRSDEDGPTGDQLDLYDNRVIIGARSVSRGENFVSYLNCSDEQNPIGVTVAAGANTVFTSAISAPTGRLMLHTTTGASAWTDECTFTLGPSIARDFYGNFHTFLRAQQVDFDTAIGEVKLRLQIRTGSGGITYTSEEVVPPNLNGWRLLDFQSIKLPATSLLKSSELTDETSLVVQVWSSVAALTAYFLDLVNIPTDEWAGDFVDQALEDDSGVTNGYLLDVDSVTFPKRDIRALVKTADEAFIRSSYQPITPAPATLQANADQQLHFLTARGIVTGTHTGANGAAVLTDSAASFLTSGVKVGQTIWNVTDGSTATITGVTATTVSGTLAGGTDDDWDTNDEYYIICANWRSEPWVCHSVQLVGAARYLSMRGDR